LPHTTASQDIVKWPLGLAAACIGSVLFVLGMQLMHIGISKKLRAEAAEDRLQRKSLDRLWWIGVITHVFAAACIAAALNFAAVSLVMPMAAMTLAINSICVPILNQNERSQQSTVEWSAVKGSLICLVGAFFMVSSAQKFNTAFSAVHLEQLFEQYEFVAFEMMCIFFIMFMLYLARTRPRRHHGRRAFLLMFFSLSAGWAGAQQYLGFKAMMELWKAEHLGKGPMVSRTFFGILFCCLVLLALQLVLVNTGLKMFSGETVRFIGVYQASLLLIGSVSGGIYFQEFIHFNEIEWISFGGGMVMMIWGIGVITLLRGKKQDEYLNTSEDREKRCGGLFVYWICGPYRVLFREDPEFIPKPPAYADDLLMTAEFDKVWGRDIMW
jgi:hypothetical protein